MNHLCNNHSVQPSQRVVRDEDNRLAVGRDVLYALDRGGASEFFIQHDAYKIVVRLRCMLAEKGVHLFYVCDAFKIANKEIRHSRLRRFRLDDSSYVKLQGHYCTA